MVPALSGADSTLGWGEQYARTTCVTRSTQTTGTIQFHFKISVALQEILREAQSQYALQNLTVQGVPLPKYCNSSFIIHSVSQLFKKYLSC